MNFSVIWGPAGPCEWCRPPSLTTHHNFLLHFVSQKLTHLHHSHCLFGSCFQDFKRKTVGSCKWYNTIQCTFHFTKTKYTWKTWNTCRDIHLFREIDCSMSWRFIRAQFHFPHSSLVAAEKRSEIWVICREGSYDVMAAISIKQYFFLHLIRQHNFVYVSFFSKSRILKYFIGIQSCLAKREYNP